MQRMIDILLYFYYLFYVLGNSVNQFTRFKIENSNDLVLQDYRQICTHWTQTE
jgi:hypothetical protein